MRFNLYRPILIVVTAIAARMLTTSVATLLGVPENTAINLGYMVMIITALIVFNKIKPGPRPPK